MARPSTIEFLKTETGAGALLGLAALAALVSANSLAAPAYFAFINQPFPVRLGPFEETRSIAGWARDGLMTVFFLVVGMEIKFEVLRGEFSSPRRLALPFLAATGGMVGSALIYLAVNAGGGVPMHGWLIPTPTDMAFSLAALAMFGRRLPDSLRFFLLTLAMTDNLVSIMLSALLVHAPIQAEAMVGACAMLGVLAALSRWKAAPRLFYATGFLAVWAFTLASGISTSAAGLACALTVPIGARRADQQSVLKTFQDGLHPYVAYAVLPFFAFVSAGFSFSALGSTGLLSPVPLGIALGLCVGKPLGAMGGLLLGVLTRIARRPLGTLWVELLGVSLLSGAGFIMSFFIGSLTFDHANALLEGQIRAAVTTGSLASTLVGGAVLSWARGRREAGEARV